MPEETLKSVSNPRNSNLVIAAAVIVAGAIIAAAVMYVGGLGGTKDERAQSTKGDSGQTAAAGVFSGDLAGDSPSLGDPNAPVTFVEFGDFQCPFCGRFFREVENGIIEKYVKTGKVRFVYRDFAFLGDESILAAEAASCANEQGKFWPYHDKLYNFIWDNYYSKGINGENVGVFSSDSLNRFARELNLDDDSFSRCLSSRRWRDKVKTDMADGRAAGVSGTPTAFINGKAAVGALPLSEFESLIDAALTGRK